MDPVQVYLSACGLLLVILGAAKILKYWPKTKEEKIEEVTPPETKTEFHKESSYLGGWACDKYHCILTRPFMDVCILCGHTVHPAVIFRIEDIALKGSFRVIVSTKTKFVQYKEEAK
jgi:hypothetical protein